MNCGRIVAGLLAQVGDRRVGGHKLRQHERDQADPDGEPNKGDESSRNEDGDRVAGPGPFQGPAGRHDRRHLLVIWLKSMYQTELNWMPVRFDVLTIDSPGNTSG